MKLVYRFDFEIFNTKIHLFMQEKRRIGFLNGKHGEYKFKLEAGVTQITVYTNVIS